MLTARQLIAMLDLRPLPLEGGYYRETYRASDRLPASALAAHYPMAKSACTAIYYLLTPETFSALHRLPTDEIFHFYLGDPVHMLQLPPDGDGCIVMLGSDLNARQHPQLLVPRGTWQGSRLAPGGSFALLGTTMAPGFDFEDFEPADRNYLIARYPAFANQIDRLIRAS